MEKLTANENISQAKRTNQLFYNVLPILKPQHLYCCKNHISHNIRHGAHYGKMGHDLKKGMIAENVLSFRQSKIKIHWNTPQISARLFAIHDGIRIHILPKREGFAK